MRQTFLAFLVLVAAASLRADEPVRFNRDVRPILTDHCVHCHGPDEARRKADLRFDLEPGREGFPAVVAGSPEKSELYLRATSNDAEVKMPPAHANRPLAPKQIDTLRRWIEQGAKWERHWSFIAPDRFGLPAVKDEKWVKNPIDHFILARLEAEKLAPSPEASKATLIRRMSLDLTGLPPTPEEVHAFVKDTSLGAVERLADRLLASPRYGERQAWAWLEAARYADTNGYQTDAGRDMWRWRDWVIEAFNSNKPFDQFTVEQIAGDMLPNATLDQKIATGFNRNHRGNAEGGIVPEEFAVEYVVDRVETTATVWLGLTLGCTRCHDHKFDPFTQKEFYRLYAYFNNVPESGKAWKYGNSPPFIKAPTREQELQSLEKSRQLNIESKRWLAMVDELRAEQQQWEIRVNPDTVRDWMPQEALVAHWPLDMGEGILVQNGQPTFSKGRIGKAFDLDGKRYIDAGDIADFGFFDKFTIAAWIKPLAANGAIVSRTEESPREEGYGVHLAEGKIQVHLTKRWLDDAIRVETVKAVPLNEWHHVTVGYDGSRLASGISVFIDGAPVKTHVLLDALNQNFAAKEPVRIGSGGGSTSRFKGLIDDVRIYRGRWVNEIILSTPESLAEILRIPTEKRTEGQHTKLANGYFQTAASPRFRKQKALLDRILEEQDSFEESIPTVMVMEEMPKSRDAFVLLRGEYDKRGEKVGPGVPSSLVPLPKGVPNNRLGFARWLVDPANPLTARVAVNRAWQSHFGTGLVKTVEDFGTQGEFPSHPDLLDWLATEFVRTGWDLKQLHKLIVTSATYRQSSRVTKELLARDPENRLLARGPRYRLSADVIRDQALFASGLLVEKQGGPSVKPYQPPGLWKELTGDADYVVGKGEELHRRSLYTYWKRTSPPPGMAAFDASAREACWVRESRTNTPLQALTLLNETTYVEAARALAARTMSETKNADERIVESFRRVLARSPGDAEMKVLRGQYDQQLKDYRRDPRLADKLLTVGDTIRDAKHDRAQLAALTSMCRLILNLDEAVTKE